MHGLALPSRRKPQLPPLTHSHTIPKDFYQDSRYAFALALFVALFCISQSLVA